MPLPDAGKKGALSLSSGHVEGCFVDHQPCGHGTGNSLFHSGACAVPGSVLAAADSAMNETPKSLLSGSLRVVNRKKRQEEKLYKNKHNKEVCQCLMRGCFSLRGQGRPVRDVPL